MDNLGKLVRFELKKSFSSISFYICGICMICISISSQVLIGALDKFFNGVSNLAQYGYSGCSILLKAISSADYPILIGIFVTIGICREYSQKTFKNVWSRGFSRSEVYFSKVIAYMVVAVIYSLVLMIVDFVLGSIIFGVGTFYTKDILNILVQILDSIAYTLIFVCVSFVFKKTAIAIVIAVAVPSLLSLGTIAIDYALMMANVNFRVSDFLISNALAQLIDQNVENEYLAKGFLIAAAYIIISIVIGIWRVRKDEI